MKKKRGRSISRVKKKTKIVNKIEKKELKKAKIVKKEIKNIREYLSVIPYVRKAISEGYSKGQIKVVLLEKGWPGDYIERAFNEINLGNNRTKTKVSAGSKYNSSVTSTLAPQVRDFGRKIEALRAEVSKIVVGQEKVVSDLLICLICGGNALLEGVPGIAKTLIMNALAKTIGCSSKRIQFTADLLPTDITGFVAYSQNKGFFVVKGPVFANFVLADEINRAPPKVQSALIEVMQERQVTIGKKTYILAKPFLVMATENPLENRGVYKLPEAQIDRFLFKILVDYPTTQQEEVIMDTNISIKKFEDYDLKTILSPEQILDMQDLVKQIFIHPKIKHYIAKIVEQTRPKISSVEIVKKYVGWGASPRASINLFIAAKANALLAGRPFVIPQDVKDIAYNVLRHRILLNYQGQIDNIKTEDIISDVLNKVEVP
ncbi:MAG: MoxR family ATPase [Nanoarchaeota archaeon]|nr:MoxR family ATPase [Nanoarchaeota archaeon]